MDIRFIIQPPYAMMVGMEAITSLTVEDNVVVDGITLHLLLFSIEFMW